MKTMIAISLICIGCSGAIKTSGANDFDLKVAETFNEYQKRNYDVFLLQYRDINYAVIEADSADVHLKFEIK